MNKTFNSSFEKGSDSTSSLLRLAKEEQVRLNNLGTKINTRREAIDKVIDILEGTAFNSSINFTSALSDIPTIADQAESLTPDTSLNYPYNKSKQEKIRHVFQQEGTAMRIRDLQDAILKIEGPIKGKKTLRSFNHILTDMVSKSELLVGRIANSKRHVFYVVPQFINHDGKLKPKHFPSARSWGKLPESKRNEITNCFK